MIIEVAGAILFLEVILCQIILLSNASIASFYRYYMKRNEILEDRSNYE
jgi:hypothetical protein